MMTLKSLLFVESFNYHLKQDLRYRGKTRIRGAVLLLMSVVKVINDGAHVKTVIMGKANLNMGQQEPLMTFLEDQKIVVSTKLGYRTLYHLTEKGFLINKTWNKFTKAFFEEFNEN